MTGLNRRALSAGGRLLLACGLFSGGGAIRADDPTQTPKPDEKSPAFWNPGMKTLGGRQFWGDVVHFHGWRIQHNVVFDHYRLLDGDDMAHVTGTFEKCHKALAEIKREQKLPPMSGKGVVFLHGIVRSSKSFGNMRPALEKAGYHVFGFDYPSTRVSIADSAEYLARVLESLQGLEEINFVVHSMGGLVVRAYLAKHNDRRINRMVMLGVPNNGARMADRVKNLMLFKTVMGPAGQQLVSDPEGFIAGLPTPEFEFGIVAGARGTKDGYNPLVPGDDDGTVSVDSARLAGATDFVTVRCLHSFLPSHEESVDVAVRFIKTGRFREEGEPQPIPRKERVENGSDGDSN